MIWLSQSSYIDKIANLAVSKQSDAILMLKDELLSYINVAQFFQINLYQWKISFLMYVTVIIHSDIAFAVSWLAYFLMNSESLHLAAADWMLLYLKRYRDLKLQLNEDDKYTVTSDVSFANNTANQKSSQSYTIKLFEDLVEWWANKQIIIIISIIKAELMILLQAACKEIYIWQMLEELKIKLNHDNMIIQYDNQQMLHLIQTEIEKLSTKLKHVDIQNHWLHQEYQRGCITVSYIKSNSMIINSLTKTLSLNSHHWFLDQMNLIDIWNCLLDCLQVDWLQESEYSVLISSHSDLRLK